MKLLKKNIGKAAAVIIAAGIFSGCGRVRNELIFESYSGGFIAMDTYIFATVYGEDAEPAVGAVKEEIMRLEGLFSVTDENSEVFAVNRYGDAEVSFETAELVRLALEMGDMTEGSLDITVYPVVREWGFTAGEYKIPDSGTLSALLRNVDYSRVGAEEGRITLPDGAMIDLGAAAKGYAGDRAIEILKEKGVKSGLINLGGNIQALGGKPDGTDWSVGVQDPFGDGYFCVLNVCDKAVVTSGNYERYFERDGIRYWHIIDPASGQPARSGIASATVIGDSGAFCDALSTAIFVMGRDRAEKLWRESGEFEMILVLENGEVVVSEGAGEMMRDAEGVEVIAR